MEAYKVIRETLGPITDSDKEPRYRDFFDDAFNSENKKNIAITGPKGAGKSSVLRTYLRNRADAGDPINAINITIGYYDTNIADPNALHNIDVKSDSYQDNILKQRYDKEQQIEVKILNQIINQIPSKKIPESIFHIDRKHQWRKSIFRAVVLSLAFLCVIYLFGGIHPNFVERISDKPGEFFYNTWTVPNIIACLFLSVLLAIGVVMILKNYSNKRLPKLQINNCYIEPADNNDTVFNKYLDEVLYMLIESDCEAVIFEDLERTRDESIFGKLREINFILNERITCQNSETKKNKRSYIKFIYVTSDSLFESKDRVKFFDVIIPIVPVVDKSNSLEMIARKTRELSLDINRDFIGSINIYLDDMRIINNIFYEFRVYKSQLDKSDDKKNSGELDDTTMLAYLIYKNILPKDYEKFQYNKGFVYSILNAINIQKKSSMDNESNDNEQIIYGSPNEFFASLNLDFDEEYEKIISGIPKEETLDNSGREMIKYLIKYGHISIDSSEYCSYFYAENINDDEYKYIISVKQNRVMNQNYKLDNISDILNKLKGYEDSVCMLNNYLVRYITDNIEAYRGKIFKTIKKHHHVEFINGFVKFLEFNKNYNTLRKFITGLNSIWNEIFLFMAAESNTEDYKRYAELSLLYCNKERITTMNIDGCLTKLFNNTQNIQGEENEP